MPPQIRHSCEKSTEEGSNRETLILEMCAFDGDKLQEDLVRLHKKLGAWVEVEPFVLSEMCSFPGTVWMYHCPSRSGALAMHIKDLPSNYDAKIEILEVFHLNPRSFSSHDLYVAGREIACHD